MEVAGIDGVVSTTPTGSIGCLKHNTLGLSRAVYYPALGEKRLISVSDVSEQGWAVYMDQKESAIKRGGEREKFGGRITCPELTSSPSSPKNPIKRTPPHKRYPVF